MRKYECLFIVDPEAASARFDQVKTAIRQDIERVHGLLDKTEELGQRVLGYAVRHCREGFYYLVQFSVEPQSILEIQARYRLNPDIVRFLILAAE